MGVKELPRYLSYVAKPLQDAESYLAVAIGGDIIEVCAAKFLIARHAG
jgi:hypothetical protein